MSGSHKPIPGAQLKDYKIRAISAAKQLGYVQNDPTIVERIRACKNESEVTLIMRTARHKEEE